VQPGGIAIMVNDNVQYHGEELPVDLILSDRAETRDLPANIYGPYHVEKEMPASKWGALAGVSSENESIDGCGRMAKPIFADAIHSTDGIRRTDK
jgi:hypothetical protein